MKKINISMLKPHPRNNEFFDDITGDAWNQFLDSVKSSGIVEPIVTTQDYVIVSGHQRFRAAKQLGFQEVEIEIRDYDDDDQVLKDLIETNIRQRGVGNPNPVKFGKCIRELERIYGIRSGSAGKRSLDPKVSAPKEEDLAKELGMSVDTLQNYKKLTEMIPELEDLVDTGIVSQSTALAIVKKLSPEDQEQFVASMDVTEKITKAQAQKYIDELERARAQLREIDGTEMEDQYQYYLSKTAKLLCAVTDDFFKEIASYSWLIVDIKNIPGLQREAYIDTVYKIKNWVDRQLHGVADYVEEMENKRKQE